MDEEDDVKHFQQLSEQIPWTELPEEPNQVERFGYKLSHFRKERETRLKVQGGRNKKILYSVFGFSFSNLEQTKSTLEETMICTINDYVKTNVDNIDVEKNKVTMAVFHEKLRDNEGTIFIHLNAVARPGEAVINFIEKFSMSNHDLKLDNKMDIDFFIS